MTQLYYEVTAGGERQDCPHTDEQVAMFLAQVTENIGASVMDNHLGPLVVSRASADQTIEYTRLFISKFSDALDPTVIASVLQAIADAWDDKYPGVISNT